MTWENRFTFEVSSADPDATPVWVDLTPRILDELQPIEWANGRQNNLDQSEPGNLSVLLNNSDGALTFGNTASPYYSWWGPGRKCRLRERIGQSTIDQFTGYLQVPEELLLTEDIEARVSVTATDRLARLRGSRNFVSNLTEYIRYSGGTALRQYWPCLEQSGIVFRNLLAATGVPVIKFAAASANLIVPTAGVTALIPGGSEPVLADDASPVLLTAATGILSGLERIAATNDYRVDTTGPDITVAAGQIITMVGWYRPDLPQDRDFVSFVSFGDTGGGVNVKTVDSTGTLNLTGYGTLTTTIVGPILPEESWVPIAIRYGWDTAVVELWVGSTRYPGVLAGVPAGPEVVISEKIIVGFYAGAFAHIQFYVGAAADWDFNDYLDQYEFARFALERQTTGERIRTVAQFAGVPTAELSLIDTGTSTMQVASLAGKDPLTAMREAETTEQGLLSVDGSGNLRFYDRRRLYNI